MANYNNNSSPAPSETYSDDDQDHYNSNHNNNSPEDAYSTPASVSDETSNDPNAQYGLSADSLNSHNNKPFIADYNAQIGYNYQIQQYLSNNLQQTATGSYDANSMYQQGINNDLVQPYSVANFDFSNDTSHFVQQKVSASEEEERQEYSTIKPCPNNEETTKREPDEVARTNETKGSFSAEYLMRPPDSESIAAAALTAKKNRNKRRTRIKFEQEQLDLLEASFERTHYPDVNVVDRLSEVLKINTDKICIWFQNRRAKFKRTKKPSGNRAGADQQSELLSEFSERQLDLLESAQKELIDKRQQQQAEQNERETNNGTPKSAYSESIPGSTKKANTSSRSQNSESFYEESNASLNNETYTSSSHQSAMLKLPITYSQPQQIFRPHMLMDQNQFYQPEIKTEYSHSSYYSYADKLPEEAVRQERTSLSPINTTDSRSESPESESSASPGTSEESQDSYNNNQNYNQSYSVLAGYQQQQQDQEHQQFHDTTNNYLNYYSQHNVMFNPYASHQNYYANGSFRHQPPGVGYMPPQLPVTNNIFQPYIDCNSHVQQQQQQEDNNQYYHGYYNE